MIDRLTHALLRTRLVRSKRAMNRVNVFLQEVRAMYISGHMHVHLSILSMPTIVNRIFNNYELIRFIEGNNYRHIEKGSLFIGSIFDRTLVA